MIMNRTRAPVGDFMIMDSFGRYVVETIHDHGITQPKPAPL